MKRNAILEELRQDITLEDKIYTRYHYDLVIRISSVLERKGWSQKDLAESMGKKPSEISKWMNGHNLTLKTIAKMESVLGENLLYSPKEIGIQHIIGKPVSMTVFKSAPVNPGNFEEIEVENKEFQLSA